MNPHRQALAAIYEEYEKWSRDFSFACARGCATCCTQSVTMTTLEGELIYAFIMAEKPELLSRLQTIPPSASAPGQTTNQFAASCLKGEQGQEERSYWNLAPCIFLEDNCCTVYPARSFMCRSFGSRVRCGDRGAAEIEPLFLTLNTVVMQCIEHLDQGRPWGNMNSILRILVDSRTDKPAARHSHLLAEPIPGFLLLPEEMEALQERIGILLDILRQTARRGKKLQ